MDQSPFACLCFLTARVIAQVARGGHARSAMCQRPLGLSGLIMSRSAGKPTWIRSGEAFSETCADLVAAADRRFDLSKDVLVLRLEALPGAALAANVDHRLVLAAVANDGHRLFAAFHPIH